jgi:hypothetical protein
MFDLTQTLIDGGILTLIFTGMLVLALTSNKRYFLVPKNYPADIIAAVPPQTDQEKRNGRLLILPFFALLFGFLLWSTYWLAEAGAGFVQLFLHVFVIAFMPFIIDLVIFDWLILNTWTPAWVVFPGTEGFAGYKDYMFHARAHLRGLVGLIIVSALIAGIFTLLV